MQQNSLEDELEKEKLRAGLKTGKFLSIVENLKWAKIERSGETEKYVEKLEGLDQNARDGRRNFLSNENVF